MPIDETDFKKINSEDLEYMVCPFCNKEIIPNGSSAYRSKINYPPLLEKGGTYHPECVETYIIPLIKNKG